MPNVNIAAAKARLPELVERASSGEVIVLSRRGKPMAKLVPLSQGKRRYVFGAGKGQWRGIERALAQPLPDELQTAFESGPVFPEI